MTRAELVERLAIVLHQMDVHMLDALKDYGEAGLKKKYEELVKHYKELKPNHQLYYRIWAARVVNLLEAWKCVTLEDRHRRQ